LESFVAYVSTQRASKTLLIPASRILCTLARNANVFFLFVFDNESGSTFQQLLESMLFHASTEVAFNFCSLSTTLLVMHAARANTEFTQRLFESTQSGLFAIILECDRALQEPVESKNATLHFKVICS
jgi:hypothetical protein